MKHILFFSFTLAATVVFASSQKEDVKLKQAIEIVKILEAGKGATFAGKIKKSDGESTVVTVTYSYETSESGVECTKDVKFVYEEEQEAVVITQGLCFS